MPFLPTEFKLAKMPSIRAFSIYSCMPILKLFKKT